jgi:hypothetical protein
VIDTKNVADELLTLLDDFDQALARVRDLATELKGDASDDAEHPPDRS